MRGWTGHSWCFTVGFVGSYKSLSLQPKSDTETIEHGGNCDVVHHGGMHLNKHVEKGESSTDQQSLFDLQRYLRLRSGRTVALHRRHLIDSAWDELGGKLLCNCLRRQVAVITMGRRP
jgi:hypothetical protein